ncbi:hypothetical protein [Nocardia wallacei]|uniref:Uncharacterized protein n=1 Tax=Nocardia wallacei TaxID=480035 RepID=A0A7G1KV27_9NOCA|nr:hypothetical protein [Nocardia wallacei]BCK58406.1 hypothetical protein NWFMUON74_61780 [Nocardia wallacei]
MVLRRPLVSVAGSLQELSDADTLTGQTVGVMLYQTQGLHVAGTGHLPMGWVVPYAMVLDQVRYWLATAGTGNSATAELRKNGTAVGNVISGTSGTPSTAPTYLTPGATLAAGDRIYVVQTAVNTTTLGTGLAADLIGHRI